MANSQARGDLDFNRPSAGISDERVEALPGSPRGLSLRRNFAWTLIGNVIYAACQWGMLMALAKLGSPEMVGQFALGLAIGAPVMMLANLQLRSVHITDARNVYVFGDYLGLRLLTTALALGFIGLFAWVAGYRWQTALVIALVGVAKSVESISDVVYGIMQKYERLDRIAIAMILRGVGSVVLISLTIWLTQNVAWAVLALALWWALILGVYECRAAQRVLEKQGGARRDLRPVWNAARMKSLVWLSLPLGATAMLVSLNSNIPRYFVEHHLDEAALGYFAALAYLMFAGQSVLTALGQSASPRLARYFATDRGAFKRLLGKMSVLAVAVGGVGILMAAMLGRPLLTLLYRRDYAEHANVYVWVMLAAGIHYVELMLRYGITAARFFRPQVLLNVACSLGITLTCALLIKSHGMFAAAYALVVGAGIALVGAIGILMAGFRLAHQPVHNHGNGENYTEQND